MSAVRRLSKEVDTREILFRGKRINNGEWVEGDLLTGGIDYLTAIRVPESPQWKPVVAVDPTTVGQFTGLTANGKKIFEGDIVHLIRHVHSINPLELVEYCGGCFSPFAIPGWECTPDADDPEVIGNIHDNPELLWED